MPRRVLRYYSLVATRRMTAFMRRVVTPHTQPRELARGASIGLIVGLSPFLGFHIMLTLILSYVLRASKLMAFTFIFVTNPWTIVPIFAIEGHIGEIVIQSPDRVFNGETIHALINSVEKPRLPEHKLRQYLHLQNFFDLLRSFPTRLWTILSNDRFLSLLWRMTVGWAALALPLAIATYWFIDRWAARIHLRRLRLPHWRRHPENPTPGARVSH